MSAGNLSGVVTVPNIPNRLKIYAEQSLQKVFELNPLLKSTSSPYRRLYESVMLKSLVDVRRTVQHNAKKFHDSDWRLDNQNNSTDALGVPFRKDGTILVVTTSIYETRTVGPAGNIFQYSAKPSSPAEFDSVFNRIIITPVFAELLRTNRVRTLGADGKYHIYSLADVIHHEWGHSGDRGFDPRTMEGSKYDNAAEIAERLGQLIDGRSVRAPHGAIEYQTLDGSWASWSPKNLADMAKIIELENSIAGELGLSESIGNAPDNSKKLVSPLFDEAAKTNRSSELIRAIEGLASSVALVDGGQIGLALGTVLGKRLTSNPFGQIVASGTLSTVLGAVGEFLDQQVFNGTTSTNILSAGVKGWCCQSCANPSLDDADRALSATLSWRATATRPVRLSGVL